MTRQDCNIGDAGVDDVQLHVHEQYLLDGKLSRVSQVRRVDRGWHSGNVTVRVGLRMRTNPILALIRAPGPPAASPRGHVRVHGVPVRSGHGPQPPNGDYLPVLRGLFRVVPDGSGGSRVLGHVR